MSVVVANLVEQSLLTLKILGSQPVIGMIFLTFDFHCDLLTKDEIAAGSGLLLEEVMR